MRKVILFVAVALAAAACSNIKRAFTDPQAAFFQYGAQHPATMDSVCVLRFPLEVESRGHLVPDSSTYDAFLARIQQDSATIVSLLTMSHDSTTYEGKRIPCPADTASIQRRANSILQVLSGGYVPRFIEVDTVESPRLVAQVAAVQTTNQSLTNVHATDVQALADKETTVKHLTWWIVTLAVLLALSWVIQIIKLFKVL